MLKAGVSQLLLGGGGGGNNQLASADIPAACRRGILYAPDYVINAGARLIYGAGAQTPRRKLVAITAHLTQISRRLSRKSSAMPRPTNAPPAGLPMPLPSACWYG